VEVGAIYRGSGVCEFTVWAPHKSRISLRLVGGPSKIVDMKKDGLGYWKLTLDDVKPGTRYIYRLNGAVDRPDPASNLQPEGVHGPSQVVDHISHRWCDGGWGGVPLKDMVIYELHVGAFTPEGTFDAAISRLDALADLGVNTIEIMPIAQFPGDRNWGYDGVYPYAVQSSYGGPEGLKRLVEGCHLKGIALILDVVYNHLGLEGNYLGEFGPYFTPKYKTPWGLAVNFDGPFSDEVRDFFIENAFYWFREYHVDALRLDAVHSILDMNARPFLQELAESVSEFCERFPPKRYLIAESDLNDSKIVKPRELGGYGIDAQWLDDFHHSLHALLTREYQGYYVDFGRVEDLVKAFREGYVYSGEYSKYRRRRHGNSSKDIPTYKFVVFAQNHDQVGNRLMGERLSSLIPFEGLKLAAGLVLLSPYIPLIFMGDEYGEESPFLYFTSYSDQRLAWSIRQSRLRELRVFRENGEPPDHQACETFQRSKIRWEKRGEGGHHLLLEFYRHLIRLRRNVAALSRLDREGMEVLGLGSERLLLLRRRAGCSEAFCIFNFNHKDVDLPISLPGEYHRLLDSAEDRWGGPGTLVPEVVSSGVRVPVKGLSFTILLGAEKCVE